MVFRHTGLLRDPMLKVKNFYRVQWKLLQSQQQTTKRTPNSTRTAPKKAIKPLVDPWLAGSTTQAIKKQRPLKRGGKKTTPEKGKNHEDPLFWELPKNPSRLRARQLRRFERSGGCLVQAAPGFPELLLQAAAPLEPRLCP